MKPFDHNPKTPERQYDDIDVPRNAMFSVHNGRIATWSKEAGHVYGYSATEAVGQAFVPTLWHVAAKGELDDLIVRLKAEDKDVCFETTHLHKDGSPIPVSMTLSLLLDASGESQALIITVQRLLEVDPSEDLWDDIQEVVVLARQQQKITSLAAQLEDTEALDRWTGLTKRRIFDNFLDRECQRSARYGTPLSLMMLNVDRQEHVRERRTALNIETILQQIAHLLQQEARTTDLVASYEDELYCVALPHTDRDGALVAAERIRRRIAGFFGPEHHVTVSVGISTYSQTMETRGLLVAGAEKALFIANQDGGDRAIHFETTWDFALAQAGSAAARDIDRTSSPAVAAVRTIEASTLNVTRTELATAYDRTIECWSRVLDLRDPEAHGHTERVAEMTVCLAQMLGVRDQELVYMRWGALLHDIGNAGIPDSILSKPEPLTPDEWTVVRSHTTLAREVLETIPFLQPALHIPASHHERWDGTGYPQGLCAEEIPLAARIFAIVDVWDVLTSDRPYRKAWSQRDALDYIYSLSGKHFDPRVVRAFHQMMLACNIRSETEPVFFAA